MTRVPRLEELLDSQSISAVLQPIVSLEPASGTLKTFGFEGLARGPKGSRLRSPEVLLGYASRKERLFELELQCIEAVLQEARHLPRVGRLFINVRPSSLSTPGFADAVGSLVLKHGFERTDIVLELTEQKSIHSLEAFEATLQTLRDCGFGLALDDFGDGFANLRLLRQLPLDYLKMDGYFCRDIDNDRRKQSIVHATCEMARELGISTIMEHIETQAELEVVKALGASYAQGYLFSRPLPGRGLARSFRGVPATSPKEPSSSSNRGASLPAGDDEFVRHEISNLLTAIALCSTQSMARLTKDDPLFRDLERILLAAERAVALSEK